MLEIIIYHPGGLDDVMDLIRDMISLGNYEFINYDRNSNKTAILVDLDMFEKYHGSTLELDNRSLMIFITLGFDVNLLSKIINLYKFEHDIKIKKLDNCLKLYNVIYEIPEEFKFRSSNMVICSEPNHQIKSQGLEKYCSLDIDFNNANKNYVVYDYKTLFEILKVNNQCNIYLPKTMSSLVKKSIYEYNNLITD